MASEDLQRLAEDALAALRGGNPLRALALADQLVEAAPDVAAPYAIRASALLASDSPEAAVDDARRACQLNPDDVAAPLLLAQAAWRCGNIGQAQQAFELAVVHSSRDPSILADYAWFLALHRAPRVAEEAARDAVRAGSDSAVAWAALGLAQHRLHQPSLAKNTLKRALQLDPNDARAQAANLIVLEERGEAASAAALAQLMADNPDNAQLVDCVQRQARQRRAWAMTAGSPLAIQFPRPARVLAWWFWFAGGMLVIALAAAVAMDFSGLAWLAGIMLAVFAARLAVMRWADR